jgi:transcriptional regulator with XRE-family HTH domain
MAPIKRPPRARRKTYIREWRQFRQLTLAAAGKLTGFDHSSIQRLETGQTPYSQDHIEALAQIYECEPAQLIYQDPGSSRQARSAENALAMPADSPTDVRWVLHLTRAGRASVAWAANWLDWTVDDVQLAAWGRIVL